jgi:DNA-binding CsgD family transcriptional regulator
MVDYLIRLRIRGRPQPWVKLRAPTEQKNLAKKLSERQSLASISAERQRRLDKVRELWEQGLSPIEIGQRLGHRHTAIYADLRALGIDPKQSQSAKQQSERKGALLEQIATLVESGHKHSEIAPIVNLSPEMVSYHARRLVKSGRLAASTNIGRRRTTK